MRPVHLLTLIAITSLAGGPAPSQDGDRERDFDRRGRFSQRQRDENDAFSAQYAVVVENNIFLRDRQSRRTPATASTTQAAPPPDPLKDFVLVGVVFEEGEFRAYFENLKGGGITRAVVGDALATGSLGEVFIDAIGFTTADGLKWIEIGQNLTGEYALIPDAQRPAVAAGAPGAPAAPGAQTSGTPNTSNMSIEERLRQRRLQETGAARPANVRGIPQPGVPPQLGELPPGAIIDGDMIIMPVRQTTNDGAEVEVLVVPQRAPPPTDQPQRRPG